MPSWERGFTNLRLNVWHDRVCEDLYSTLCRKESCDVEVSTLVFAIAAVFVVLIALIVKERRLVRISRAYSREY